MDEKALRQWIDENAPEEVRDAYHEQLVPKMMLGLDDDDDGDPGLLHVWFHGEDDHIRTAARSTSLDLETWGVVLGSVVAARISVEDPECELSPTEAVSVVVKSILVTTGCRIVPGRPTEEPDKEGGPTGLLN